MECQNREYFLSSTESDPKSISDSESSGHYSVVISLRILDLAFLDLFEAESEKIYIPFVSSFRRGEKEKKTQAVSPVTWKDSSKKDEKSRWFCFFSLALLHQYKTGTKRGE